MTEQSHNGDGAPLTVYANGPLPPHLVAHAYFTADGREWALRKPEALEYLDWCEQQGLRVLGFDVWYPSGPTPTDFGLGNVEGVAAVRDLIRAHPGRYVWGAVVFNITVDTLNMPTRHDA
jgi:hypothetical protein